MGRQCEEENCTKGARDGTGYCIAHGGGKRCQKAAPRRLKAASSSARRMAGSNASRMRAARSTL